MRLPSWKSACFQKILLRTELPRRSPRSHFPVPFSSSFQNRVEVWSGRNRGHFGRDWLCGTGAPPTRHPFELLGSPSHMSPRCVHSRHAPRRAAFRAEGPLPPSDPRVLESLGWLGCVTLRVARSSRVDRRVVLLAAGVHSAPSRGGGGAEEGGGLPKEGQPRAAEEGEGRRAL